MYLSGVHESFSCTQHLSRSKFASCKILMAELLLRSDTFTFFRLLSLSMCVFAWFDVGFGGLFTWLLGLLHPWSSLLLLSLFSRAEMRHTDDWSEVSSLMSRWTLASDGAASVAWGAVAWVGSLVYCVRDSNSARRFSSLVMCRHISLILSFSF